MDGVSHVCGGGRHWSCDGTHLIRGGKWRVSQGHIGDAVLKMIFADTRRGQTTVIHSSRLQFSITDKSPKDYTEKCVLLYGSLLWRTPAIFPQEVSGFPTHAAAWRQRDRRRHPAPWSPMVPTRVVLSSYSVKVTPEPSHYRVCCQAQAYPIQ